VEGSGYFKVRILMSGTLRARTREIIATAPEALLYVSPGASREGYYIASGESVRMIVLHCRPQLLTHVLGLHPQDIPLPLSSLLIPERTATRRRLTPSPEVIQVARRIMESRHRLSLVLRDRYLQTLSMELLLQVLGILDRRTLVATAPSGSSRDAARIYEARDYLAQPSIREELVSLVPAGRLGTTGEVADAVTFLASDRAAFITGHIMYVDGGRILNPGPARNQIEGAVVMGIGMALFEATHYDTRFGAPINNNLADYIVATNADAPSIDVTFLDYPDLVLNPLGARGVGEIGLAGVAAAITNAVHHATGVRVRELPVRIEDLLVS